MKRGFYTHLKMRGIIDKYDITETNLEIVFNVPTNFYELRENQKLELKAANYSSLAGNEFVSATYAQKKYLGWKEAAAAESIAAEPGAGGEGGGVAVGDVGVDGGVPEFGGGEATEGEIPDVAEPVEPAAEV